MKPKVLGTTAAIDTALRTGMQAQLGVWRRQVQVQGNRLGWKIGFGENQKRTKRANQKGQTRLKLSTLVKDQSSLTLLVGGLARRLSLVQLSQQWWRDSRSLVITAPVIHSIGKHERQSRNRLPGTV